MLPTFPKPWIATEQSSGRISRSRIASIGSGVRTTRYCAFASSSGSANQTITVNENTTYQQFEGAGASEAALGFYFGDAAEGDGFLAVSTGAGTRYTRNGQLSLDSQGRLTTVTGYLVLGTNGQPITATGILCSFSVPLKNRPTLISACPLEA